MYDWGLEASLGYFILRNKMEPYGRTSFVIGPYRKSAEGAGGLNWCPFGTRGALGECPPLPDARCSVIVIGTAHGAPRDARKAQRREGSTDDRGHVVRDRDACEREPEHGDEKRSQPSLCTHVLALSCHVAS